MTGGGALEHLRGECRSPVERRRIDRAESIAWRRAASRGLPFGKAWEWVWERALCSSLRTLAAELGGISS